MWKCPICGWETEFDPQKQYQFWPHTADGTPFCYQCLIVALEKIVPHMYRVQEK